MLILPGHNTAQIGILLSGHGNLGTVVSEIITATVAPATSVLVSGQALDETTNWATLLLTSNYATSAGGETISSVVVNYIGDTATAAETLLGGETNHFSITVTDTAANERTFTTTLRTVAATVPDAFVIGDWSLVDDTSGLTLAALITDLPFDGGDPVTDIEYRIDTGSWVSSGNILDFDIPVAANATSYDIEIRAVNSVGSSAASDIKAATATDTVAPTVGSYIFDGTDTIDVTVTESDVASWEWMVDDNATRTAAQVDAGGGLASGSFAISAGANSDDIDVSLVPVGNHYLHGVPKDTTGNVADAQVQSDIFTFSGTVPDAFIVGDWTLTDPGTAGDLLVTISSLPNANSDTITDVEYRLDGGSWVSSGGTVTFTIPGLTDTVEYDVELRAVSAAGNALAGDLKSQTPTAGDVTAPTLSSPTDAADGATASTGSVSTNEGNGTLYWVVTTSATAPSAAQVKLGQDNSSVAATDSGSQSVSGTGVQTITPAPSGLTGSTAYTTHFMHEDAAANQSTVSSASGFTTAAAGTAPEMVTFDGSGDIWNRGADLTGISNSQYIAGYLKFNMGTQGSTNYMASSNGESFAIRVTTGGILQIRLENDAGNPRLFLETTTAIDDSTDHEIWWNYNGSAGTAELYLDGTDDANASTLGTGTINMTETDWSVGGFVSGTAYIDADIERVAVWVTDVTGFADFDVTDSADRAAMADHTQGGTLGNGSENRLDMYGPPATWNAGTNQGSGGDGTMTGAVA